MDLLNQIKGRIKLLIQLTQNTVNKASILRQAIIESRIQFATFSLFGCPLDPLHLAWTLPD